MAFQASQVIRDGKKDISSNGTLFIYDDVKAAMLELENEYAKGQQNINQSDDKKYQQCWHLTGIAK